MHDNPDQNVLSLKACTVRNMKLHEFFYVKQLFYSIDFAKWIYISILLHVSVAVQVWPQAAFHWHPFLVADLRQRPDIGDL